ncbi:MAG: PaaI family thioesterase [Candidatus Eremiobacteraeota bacterium]|nr:PaaI family thioesterase [Candidatus Eremiobacteraeota bacterium]
MQRRTWAGTLQSARCHPRWVREHTLGSRARTCVNYGASDPATGVGTTDLSVKYIRAMQSSVGTVICQATVVHAGNTIVVASSDLRDRAGTLYATAQSTCVVLRAKA